MSLYSILCGKLSIKRRNMRNRARMHLRISAYRVFDGRQDKKNTVGLRSSSRFWCR